MCYLKIPKDCLVRQYKETAFGYGGTYRPNTKHYVFRLPGEEYDGYTFTVTELFGRFDAVQALGDWYSVNVSSDDLPIAVKRTENREDGKRYKRYKLNATELAAMYGCDFQHAVALVSLYANNGTRRAKEIISTKYAVGVMDGCWFICSEFSERRRINTKGVKILGYISPTDAKTVGDVIEQHKTEERRIHRALSDIQDNRRKIQNIDSDVDRIGITELAGIKDITAKALESLSKKYRKLISELEIENKQFENTLGAYYIGEVA